MIEKVEITTNTQPQTELENSILRVFNGVAIKMNEIIDTVNELQATISKMEKVEPTDLFAEQRKWEGKLCWFWDEDPEDKIVDVLSCIDTSDKYPYVMCDRQVHYKHCEPVKPDDDIVFKGK